MFEFMEDLFYDWTTTSWIVWIVLSLGSIYVAWFVKIPSAIGLSTGFPPMVSIGVSVIIPVITWYMLNNKEWTADTFRDLGKKR